MSFPFSVYFMAFVGACASTAIALPLWRAWCIKDNLVDDPGHRKIHDTPIPLAGGLAVMTGFLVPILAGATLVNFIGGQSFESNVSIGPVSGVGVKFPNLVGSDALTYGLSARALQLGTILIGAVAMVVLGWLDDKHELKPAGKFTGQFVIAALVAASGVRITLFVDNLLFSYAVTILWILTLINAFNFMDNMNGLCGGLGAISAWFFALIAASHGQYLVATLGFLTCGALLGFLPFNFPKASAFLGDAGSHLVGYLMAVMAILPHFYSEENPRSLAVLSPLLILAVPLGDLVWVVILRTRMGKPFWIGDTNHLSHRLVRRGLSKTAAVLVIWLLAAAAGTLALL
ncbi:MAG: MraY family glycosyltransferase [Verrucomicrobiota bacterium]